MPLTVSQADKWVRAFADVVAERKTELTGLDSAIGDGDHGINLDRGMRAVVEKLDAAEPGDLGGLLRAVGMTLISKVGGASGPLYGTFFLEGGKSLGAMAEASDADLVAAVTAAVAGVQARGKAEPGDKTMVDALVPARDALREAVEGGTGLDEALARAAEAAERGRDATKPLVARKGRASYLGERSAGYVDPGATSSALLLRCAATTLASG
ncbi:MAG: dihydroxyacetone kinase subunit L [Streptosporangiales bacterium]|nr:dihydroxyacetone kinase subunit L [Streptosporangiales bacterium]